MNNRFDRITIDPAVMNGQPCIRGMRLTVKRAEGLEPCDSHLLRRATVAGPVDLGSVQEGTANHEVTSATVTARIRS
jgi:hypothetical protein